jgi:hypothetical protein
MANLDYGRIEDLNILADGMKNARSAAERDHYEQMAYRITKQSTRITSLRNELIKAFRMNDHSAIKRIQMRIHDAKLRETGGASWGQLKGERKLG